MSEAQLRRALTRAAARRNKAHATEREAMATIRQLAPRAVQAGIPKIEVAKAAQISRVTLDAILEEHG